MSSASRAHIEAAKIQGATATAHREEYKGVWVLMEQRDGKFLKVALELMAPARNVANKTGVPLTGIIMGHNVKGLAPEAIAYGADRAIVVDHPILREYRTEPYSHVASSLVAKHKPEIVLIGATRNGRDFASRIAIPVQGGITADTTVIDVDEERLLVAWRPAFGGKTICAIVCKKHQPQMASVRPGVFIPPPRDPQRKGEVIEEKFDLQEETCPTKIIEFIKKEQVDIQGADILVSGGAGVGGPAGFQPLQEMADALGGAAAGRAMVGASRRAVDAGWISRDHQVGQTGRTVHPKVYIACGISGSVQHLAGMKDADIIVTINKDPDANLFQYSDFGIVGDLFQVVPELTRLIREKGIKAGTGPVQRTAGLSLEEQAAEKMSEKQKK